MRRFAIVFPAAALVTLALAGCATLTASAHIERGITFTDYATYDWGPTDSQPTGDPRLDNNPFFNDQLQGAIEKGMTARGYERALPSHAPDLLIHYHAALNQKVDVYKADQTNGYCYQDCQQRASEYEQGTLILDIVDAKSSRVVWRGWAQDTFSGAIDDQDYLDQKVEAGVSKMMRLLPAGGAPAR